MAQTQDVVVIGAGVVGLAVARALALDGCDVLIIERNGAIGMEVSSRNSEVIHAGIYYPKGSLKAQLCVRGKALMYDYLRERALPHQQCGKLLVATDRSQIAVLQDYQARALANGIGDLPWVDAADIREREPDVECVAALESKSTGIVDSHALMISLHGDFESAGGAIAFQTEVLRLAQGSTGITIETNEMELDARLVVNCAGLDAPGLIQTIKPDSPHKTHLAKGHYYSLSGKSPFSQLIYPIASAGGLGVHVTLDLNGSARFGPDIQWIDSQDYSFDTSACEEFEAAIRRYYPALDASRLTPAYTGIRPKIVGPGENAADFVIETQKEHGVGGLINLIGIESPGLTSSLAIGEYVSACANKLTR